LKRALKRPEQLRGRDWPFRAVAIARVSNDAEIACSGHPKPKAPFVVRPQLGNPFALCIQQLDLDAPRRMSTNEIDLALNRVTISARKHLQPMGKRRATHHPQRQADQ
jgi:hypothetical protein